MNRRLASLAAACALVAGCGAAGQPVAQPRTPGVASAASSPAQVSPGSPANSPVGAARGPGTTAPPRADQRLGEVRGARVAPVVAHGPRDVARVALTFDADLTSAMRARLDEGRVRSYYNARLIRQLRRLQVPATLFLTGMWMERYPDVTRALAADPLFELGTHSYSHRAFTRGCYTLGTVPRAQMLGEVASAVRILDRLDPHATRYFRFPGGCHDDAALRAIAPASVTAIQFDVAGGDGFAASVQPIVDRVVDQARNGSIVVLHLHGGDTAPLTDDAIPGIVTGLRSRGFTLVKVSDLLR
jgi:peptidoglycan/xylan/chitin deacetylase (PgdA/CDA1 family)